MSGNRLDTGAVAGVFAGAEDENFEIGNGTESNELVIVPLTIDTNPGLLQITIAAAELANGVQNDGHSRNRFIRQHQIPLLSPFTVPILAVNNYGSLKVADLPATNLLILSAGVIGSGFKNTGIASAASVQWGFGTAPATNATLTGDMINILSRTQSTSTDFPLIKGHSNENSTPGMMLFLPESATEIFMNVAVAATSDSSLDMSGTLNLWYFDLGNVGT